MAVAIDNQTEIKDLLNYLAKSFMEDFLVRLSERLGKDESIFWQIVGISKGDATTLENIKLNGISISTRQVAEKIALSIQKHSLNGKGAAEDIRAAQAFLKLINNEEFNNGEG
jgi:hypothetical protein